MLWSDVGKLEPYAMLIEMYMVKCHREQCAVLKILNVELPCDPAIALLGVHFKELKAGSTRNVCPCS